MLRKALRFGLRLVAIAILKVAAAGPAKHRKWACHWLAHYLAGSGAPLRADNRVIGSAEEERRLAEMFLRFAESRLERSLEPGEYLRKAVFTTHDWLDFYDEGRARGFWAKPALFHIVGGFTLSMWVEGGLVYVVGRDVYDWHPARMVDIATGETKNDWAVSPVNAVRAIPAWARWLANKAIGADVIRRGGLSNELWPVLGGKEFVTEVRLRLNPEAGNEPAE